MSRSLYVTSTITTLFIYLYLCSFWQHLNCAKLDFDQLVRRYALKNRRHVDSPKEENVFQVLRLLRKSNLDDNEVQQILDEKRIGFGLNRGYSGAQAAKHLLGLSAANLPTSPGRRRRRAVVLMN